MESLEFFADQLQQYLVELQTLTAIETPSGNLANLQEAAEFLTDRLASLGRLEHENLQQHGPMLRLTRSGAGSRILILAHYDTIWPIGSWPSLWRVDGGRAYGPGVYDMKGGLLFIPWLLRYLDASGRSHPHLEVLLTPDEEIGALGSRPFIEEAARRSDFVLVLEPTNIEGSLKLARKGSGEFIVSIRGRATHQGVEPEKGINAVVEAAHQILAVLGLEDPALGTTLGPNVITGGSASNMVPDRAEVRVDVRAWTERETERLTTALHALQPVLAGSEIHVSGDWNRPPMEASPIALELFDRAREIGKDLGLDLGWVRWGGSSDANLAAAVGAPTIDGLGPVGEGAHQTDESIIIDRLPSRLALFTELIISLARPPEELDAAPS